LQIGLLIFEIIVNGGFEDFTKNPWFGPSQSVLVEMGAKHVPSIQKGEWWRFFVPIFLHAGIIHLLLNVLMQVRLFRFETQFGGLRVGPIYILCGIFGNVISAIFVPGQTQV
jgi:membrane associated rhomboid family serine protease